MERISCITHPKNTRFIMLQSEYLEICEGNLCASMILRVFEFETDYHLNHPTAPKTAKNVWLSKSRDDIRLALFNSFSIKTISKSLDYLALMGFITRRENPSRTTDRALQYQINTHVVQAAFNDSYPDLLGENCTTGGEVNMPEPSGKNALPIGQIYPIHEVNLPYPSGKNALSIYIKQQEEKEQEKKQEIVLETEQQNSNQTHADTHTSAHTHENQCPVVVVQSPTQTTRAFLISQGVVEPSLSRIVQTGVTQERVGQVFASIPKDAKNPTGWAVKALLNSWQVAPEPQEQTAQTHNVMRDTQNTLEAQAGQG